MRPCTPAASLCLAAAALLLPVSVPPAYAGDVPACAGGDARDFPLTTRIHGGPDTYEAGGGYGTWYLDLTNTTSRTCSGVHPVVVLVDGKRVLAPSQPRLEFYDGERPHAVRFLTTDQDELVGAFDDGFPGFTVGPGATLSVKVRLALTSDAAPNEITVNAAVVQRHEADGDWVGQSNDYRFTVEGEATPVPEATPSERIGRLPFADELASTGLATPAGAITATLALLLVGGLLLLARRRR
ncbi:hypothetical protein [Streptomyces griseus]|uniref:hypothetical protein n=1 Tax=Streptomyces griseus TaxID=1911 RepID=UPI00056BB8C0|nr:hypothetical protein [Streptomyces griseus]